ncbi:MAG: ImmA/IrrE family metallo-endopeptidase [Bacteroidetes bacterium]|nr:ImmA/IrrE family metallo-endopeptidase [Bacteroidota bacterium]
MTALSNFDTYLKTKFKVSETPLIIENAISYIANGTQPDETSNIKYIAIDNWIKQILGFWAIELIEEDLGNAKFHGKLVPKRNGFNLFLNSSLFPTQRRFALAHELGHLVSFDTTFEWPKYVVKHSWNEELFCNQVARGILLPKIIFDTLNINLQNVDSINYTLFAQIWKEYLVSPLQIIRRLYDLYINKNVSTIIWKHSKDDNCLRIFDYCKNNNYFIPLRKRKILNDLIQQEGTNNLPQIAFNSNGFIKDYDLVSFGSFYKKRMMTYAFPIHTIMDTYIVQTIFDSDENGVFDDSK